MPGSTRAAWLAAAGWLALMLAASSLPGPNLPSVPLAHADLAAHALEYLVLGVLVANAAGRSWPGPRRHTPRPLVAIVAVLILLPALDELHQAWIPGRHPSIADALADWCGLGVGLLIYWRARARRDRR